MATRKSKTLKANVGSILLMQAEIKDYYRRIDELYRLVLNDMRPGDDVVIGGQRYTLEDKFADRNVAYKAAVIRRFEIQEVKS